MGVTAVAIYGPKPENPGLAAALARACNVDPRFRAAGWRESPQSVGQLLASDGFRAFVFRLAPHGGTPRVQAMVAAVYAYRETERRRDRQPPPAAGLRRAAPPSAHGPAPATTPTPRDR